MITTLPPLCGAALSGTSAVSRACVELSVSPSAPETPLLSRHFTSGNSSQELCQDLLCQDLLSTVPFCCRSWALTSLELPDPRPNWQSHLQWQQPQPSSPGSCLGYQLQFDLPENNPEQMPAEAQLRYHHGDRPVRLKLWAGQQPTSPHCNSHLPALGKGLAPFHKAAAKSQLRQLCG